MAGFDLTLEPRPVSGRRLEGLSGDLGRRRRPGEVKARIVGEPLEPGALVSAVARRHGLRPQQLLTWRRLARAGRLALPMAGAVRFVPVVAEADASGSVQPRPATAARAGVIEIELGGAIVRVGAAVDGRQLARILPALKAARRSSRVGGSGSSSPPRPSTSALGGLRTAAAPQIGSSALPADDGQRRAGGASPGLRPGVPSGADRWPWAIDGRGSPTA
jgi:transposase